MVSVFFRCVIAMYDKWNLTVSQEDRQKLDKGRHDTWLRIMTHLSSMSGEDAEAFYGGYAAQFQWRLLQDKETGMITIVPHVADSMGTLNVMCEVAEFVYQVRREQGTAPRTQDMKDIQYYADQQEVWHRTYSLF